MGINRQPPDEKTKFLESETHGEYSSKLTETIRQIALNRDVLNTIDELTDSPVLDACTAITSQLENKLNIKETSQENGPIQYTLLDSTGAKGLLDSIWKHYARIIHSKDNSLPISILSKALKGMESIFIRGVKKPIHFFLHMLDKEDRISRDNEQIGLNTIARLGGVHSLTLPLMERPRNEHTSDHLDTLYVALGQSLVQYLLNQKDFAGHCPENTTLPEKDYIQNTRNTARQILEHLQKYGWRTIAPPELANLLKDRVSIPTDLSKVLPYGTHDYNLIQNQDGKDMISDPKISYNKNNGDISLENLAVQLVSADGNSYALSNISEIFKLTKSELFQCMSIKAGNSKLTWREFPSFKDHDQFPQVQFALSFSTEDPNYYDNILLRRANCGNVSRHLHLKINKNKHDSLIQFSSHRKRDGQEATASMDANARALGVSSPRLDLENSIQVNPFFPNTTARIDAKQSLMEIRLGLSDVEIGVNFDNQQIEDDILLLNQYIVEPISAKIRAVLGDDNPHTEEIIKIINPDINRHVLLGLIMEQDGPTANCVFPYQKYARLAFSIFPEDVKDINSYLNTKVDHQNPSSHKNLVDSIRLALTDQTLSRLGVSPLGFMGIYTSQSKKFAQTSANIVASKTKQKTDILFQISELKKGLSSIFTSAKSRFNGITTNAIGLINNRLTARLDLTDPTLLKSLDMDRDQIVEDLSHNRIPLSPSQFKVVENDLDAIGTLTEIIDLYFYQNPNASITDIITTLQSSENEMNLLIPYNINPNKLFDYLQIIFLTSAYQKIQTRSKQWIHLTHQMANHYVIVD